ncbi:MAG: hypothetical protein V1746_03635 [bacterium]
MIAPSSPLPFVQWQRQKIVPLSQDWLEISLLQSAEKAGVPHWPLCGEIAQAILYFFLCDFSGHLISAEDLQKIMRRSLEGIGRHEIAQHVRLAPPRISIYLPDIARQAPYELLFFPNLKTKLSEATQARVRGIKLEGLRRCVKMLSSSDYWRDQCQTLNDEIVSFSREHLSVLAPNVELLILS